MFASAVRSDAAPAAGRSWWNRERKEKVTSRVASRAEVAVKMCRFVCVEGDFSLLAQNWGPQNGRRNEVEK